jgi:hypothetical protein
VDEALVKSIELLIDVRVTVEVWVTTDSSYPPYPYWGAAEAMEAMAATAMNE